MIVASALATQRFVPYMHKPTRRTPSFKAMAREIGLAVSNRNFVSLAVSGLIFGIAVGISGGLQIYFNTYLWEFGSAELLPLGLWVIPGSLLGVVVAPYWARLLGKKRGCLIVFFMAIFSTTVPITLRVLGVMPPNSSPWVLRILITRLAGHGLLSTTGFIIVTSMLADVIEEVQVKTAQRSEGVLFAANSLLRKVFTSFSVALPGLMLARVHFPKFAKPGHVDPAILNHLALIYLPTVTVLYLCSTSCILLYRIDRNRHAENLSRIARVRRDRPGGRSRGQSAPRAGRPHRPGLNGANGLADMRGRRHELKQCPRPAWVWRPRSPTASARWRRASARWRCPRPSSTTTWSASWACSPAVVGLVIMVSLIIDAVLDPLIGRWSDTFRSPWGRRHPFMYASAIPIAICTVLLWRHPAWISAAAMPIYVFTCWWCCASAGGFYQIPSDALAPELAPDYHERTSLISWRWFFGVARRRCCSASCCYGVFLRRDAANPLGQNNPAGYANFGIVAADHRRVAASSSPRCATHRYIPLLQHAARSVASRRPDGARDLHSALATPRCWPSWPRAWCPASPAASPTSLRNFMSYDFWGLTPQVIALMTFAVAPASVIGVVAAPLAVARARQEAHDDRRVFTLSIFVGVIPVSLRLLGLLPPNGSRVIPVVLIADLFVAERARHHGFVIIGSMIADVVEDAAVKTGVRSEGLLFAANGLLPKFTTGFGILVGNMMLEFVHFPAAAQGGRIVAVDAGDHAPPGAAVAADRRGAQPDRRRRADLLPHRPRHARGQPRGAAARGHPHRAAGRDDRRPGDPRSERDRYLAAPRFAAAGDATGHGLRRFPSAERCSIA